DPQVVAAAMNAELSPGGEVYLKLGFGGLDRLRADSASAPRTRASPQFSIDFVRLRRTESRRSRGEVGIRTRNCSSFIQAFRFSKAHNDPIPLHASVKRGAPMRRAFPCPPLESFQTPGDVTSYARARRRDHHAKEPGPLRGGAAHRVDD